jgi:hypothetical protein
MRGTAEYDVTDFEDRTKSDPKAFVRFHLRPVKNEHLSAEAGRPIYEDKEYVEIMVPGNETNRPILKVTDIERQRFSQQYRRWKETGEDSHTTGTPLTEVPWLTRSQVEELNYARIRTLDQLAAVDDIVCQKMMGLTELRRKARDHLERAEAAAPFTAMQEQLDALKEENAANAMVIAEQAEIIKGLQKKASKE